MPRSMIIAFLRSFIVLQTLVLPMVSCSAYGVAAPYSENFDSYPSHTSPANFVTTASGTAVSSIWETQSDGTNGGYNNSLGGHSVSSSAAVNVTNLAQIDFQLSTTFILATPTLAPLYDCRVGLGALSSVPDFTSNGYYLAYEAFSFGPNTPIAGSLYLYRGSSAIGAAGFGFGSLPVVIGQDYTISLTGVYSVAGLTLSGIISNGSASLSLSTTELAPQPGTYFGYHDVAQGTVQSSSGIGVTYDNFSIAVPEPGTLAFLTIGFGFVVVGARRKTSNQAMERTANRRTLHFRDDFPIQPAVTRALASGR